MNAIIESIYSREKNALDEMSARGNDHGNEPTRDRNNAQSEIVAAIVRIHEAHEHFQRAAARLRRHEVLDWEFGDLGGTIADLLGEKNAKSFICELEGKAQ